MHYSAYFRGAFGGNFQEAQQGLLHLADEDTQTFKKVYEWLYTRNLADTLEEETMIEFKALLKLYFFGEKHMIPTLQNDVIDVIIRKCTEYNTVPSCYISIVYDNMPASSPLRKLSIDMFIHLLSGTNFREGECFYTKDFLVDIAEEMFKVENLSYKGWTYFLPSSKYHVAEQSGPNPDPPGPASEVSPFVSKIVI